MRTSIVPDDELAQRAFVLTDMRTKRELVHLALSELGRRRRKKTLRTSDKVQRDLDHKAEAAAP